jgi:hypothetical protein
LIIDYDVLIKPKNSVIYGITPLNGTEKRARVAFTTEEDHGMILQVMVHPLGLPFGYLTGRHGKSPFLRTVNHVFLWAIYTMAMFNNQRVNI